MDIKELYQLYRQHPCITTDSRNCPEGSIFLALKGEKFDGNQYALQALEKGCAYAIVDENYQFPIVNSQLIKVSDTLQTFKDLAREHRRQFDIPIVGITGTNGKTTTKELIAAVLRTQYDVMATEGNFNNDVGVPKTLFRLNDNHDIAVVEMGASHPGDIKTLVETAEPTCGLITNVGRAHLQGFGSFEGVCKTKGELYDFLISRDLPIFVNRDNEHLMQMIDIRGARYEVRLPTSTTTARATPPTFSFAASSLPATRSFVSAGANRTAMPATRVIGWRSAPTSSVPTTWIISLPPSSWAMSTTCRSTTSTVPLPTTRPRITVHR